MLLELQLGEGLLRRCRHAAVPRCEHLLSERLVLEQIVDAQRRGDRLRTALRLQIFLQFRLCVVLLEGPHSGDDAVPELQAGVSTPVKIHPRRDGQESCGQSPGIGKHLPLVRIFDHVEHISEVHDLAGVAWHWDGTPGPSRSRSPPVLRATRCPHRVRNRSRRTSSPQREVHRATGTSPRERNPCGVWPSCGVQSGKAVRPGTVSSMRRASMTRGSCQPVRSTGFLRVSQYLTAFHPRRHCPIIRHRRSHPSSLPPL